MTTDHDRLRGLALVLEDLEGDELALARDHLAGCAECAGLRERVTAAEARMRAVPGLSAAREPLASLSPAERAAADVSRRALVAGAVTDGRGRRKTWPRLLPMALAAGAALIVLGPSLTGRGPVRDLRLGSPLVLRGEASTTPPRGVSFRLARSGYPVLLHVDAGGAVRLLHPAPASPSPPLAAGTLVLLPPPESGDAWRSGLTPGCGTYLLAVATGRPPTPAQLAALATLTTGGDRRAAARGAERLLRETIGAVERLDDEDCR